jgi:ankyrin repeat protein
MECLLFDYAYTKYTSSAGADRDAWDLIFQLCMTSKCVYGRAKAALQLEKQRREEATRRLHRAASWWPYKVYIEEIESLIAAGADVNAPMEKCDLFRRALGRTVMMIACYYHLTNVVSVLIEAGADVSGGRTQFARCTPLMQASYKGALEIVRMLLEAGAEVNAVNSYGETALIYACRCGDENNENAEVVKVLLEAGANVNHQPTGASRERSYTPLMIAATRGMVDTVSVLLDAGADITLQNYQGQTAEDMARWYGRQKVVRMFKERSVSV